MNELTRRNIRYICFRIQTEILGGAKAAKETEGIMQFVDEVKDHMKSQDDFGGWDKFAKTWDIDEKSPLVIITRNSSIQTQWNTILKEEAKELSVTKDEENKKLLTNKLSEIVQEKKKAEQEDSSVMPEKPTHKSTNKKLLENDLQAKVQEIKQQQEKEDSFTPLRDPDGKSINKKTSFWDRLK